MERTYIVAIGYAGAFKAAETIVEHEKELRSRYRSSFVDRMLEAARAELEAGAGTRFMPGGYLGALYDLAEERRCGIRIRIRAIPILQSTVEVCELYGMNPYQMPAFARIILTQDPEHTLEEMDQAQRGMAACIGYLTDGHDKVIVDKTNIEYINKVRTVSGRGTSQQGQAAPGTSQ